MEPYRTDHRRGHIAASLIGIAKLCFFFFLWGITEMDAEDIRQCLSGLERKRHHHFFLAFSDLVLFTNADHAGEPSRASTNLTLKVWRFKGFYWTVMLASQRSVYKIGDTQGASKLKAVRGAPIHNRIHKPRYHKLRYQGCGCKWYKVAATVESKAGPPKFFSTGLLVVPYAYKCSAKKAIHEVNYSALNSHWRELHTEVHTSQSWHNNPANKFSID